MFIGMQGFGIAALVSVINAIRHPIQLKIKSNDVATAKIIFYGDGFLYTD